MRKLNTVIEKILQENPIIDENGKTVPHWFEYYPGCDGEDVPDSYIVYEELPPTSGVRNGTLYYRYAFTIYAGCDIFVIQNQLRKIFVDRQLDIDNFSELLSLEQYGIFDPTRGIHRRTLVFGVEDIDEMYDANFQM